MKFFLAGVFALLLAQNSQAVVTYNSENPDELDGNYRMELTIDNQVFIDELVLKGKNKAIDLSSFKGDITGSVTVPGSFTSPITGTGFCTDWNNVCSLYFTIEANENGKTYKVTYSAILAGKDYFAARDGISPPRLTGTAALEDGKVLGQFTAIRR